MIEAHVGDTTRRSSQETLRSNNNQQAHDQHHELSFLETTSEKPGDDSATLPDTLSIQNSVDIQISLNDVPPDGGFGAWWQVAMGHIVIFNTWGYINSFGLFQTYYESILSASPSTISWIGSIQVFLMFFLGVASGRAADAGYFKLVFSLGLFLQLLGTFMTSLSTTYWQLLLAQGICTGVGNGLMFCPTVSVVSTYFLKHRGIAIGIIAAGTGTGGLIFPIVAQKLLPTIGFGWTVRVMGFIMMGTMCLPLAFSKSRLPPRKIGPLVEWKAFKESSFTLYTIGATLCFWGLYFAFYYISTYGISELGMSESDSLNLLLILNGVGIPARLIPNIISDRWLGPINTMIPFAAISALLLYVWISINTTAGIFIFAVLYGCVAAGMLSLWPAALASLSVDQSKIGVRLGMVMTCLGFACLTGPPIGGALIAASHGGYVSSQAFFGSIVALGAIFLLFARVSRVGWVFPARA